MRKGPTGCWPAYTPIETEVGRERRAAPNDGEVEWMSQMSLPSRRPKQQRSTS